MSKKRTALLIALLVAVAATDAPAQRKEEAPKELQEVGVTEKLDAELPLDTPFVDADGNKVTLGDMFDGTVPVILTLNYSDCPMLCHLQLNGLLATMKRMPWTLGEEYRIVTISVDPLETPERAKLTKQKYLKNYGRAKSPAAWRFLTSRDEAKIRKVADAVGFGYRYVPETKEYAHAAALMLCTPDGRVSSYRYGIEYDPQTLRLSLLEAGEGKVGSTVDQILMFCFHYDAESGRYGPAAFRIMQLGGGLTVLLLGGLLLVLWRRGPRPTPNESDTPQSSTDES